MTILKEKPGKFPIIKAFLRKPLILKWIPFKLKFKEERFEKAKFIIMRNTAQRIQRFYRQRLDQKENTNDKKERMRMDVYLSLHLYGKLLKKFLKRRKRRIIPNFLYKTRFFFEFDSHFEIYRAKGTKKNHLKFIQ
jgi:hypothetical protein